jgi:hypothetical protein
VKEIAFEHKEELVVIAINVDEASKLAQARRIIEKYELPWPNIMTGLGNGDPIWKMLGGMQDNRLTIPFYVVVDTNGILRYAGSGGDDLAEFRTRLREVLKRGER